MRKIIFALVGLIFVGAAAVAAVAERTDCAATKERIDKLAALAEPEEADKAELAELRALYRKSCTVSTGGRGARTIASKRVGVKESVVTEKTDDAKKAVEEEGAPATEEVMIAESCSAPDANGCCPGEEFADYGIAGKYCCKDDFCFPPMDVKPAEPQKTEEEIAEEIAANIEKGLCGDGTKPNKYGCCVGEIFKDLGNGEFGCCKKDTDECFPPMK